MEDNKILLIKNATILDVEEKREVENPWKKWKKMKTKDWFKVLKSVL